MKAKGNTTVVSALTARTQLGQILRRVKLGRERFLISKNGEPQAVILGIDDYVDALALTSNSLKNSSRISQNNGTDKLTMRQIDATGGRGETTKKISTVRRK